MSLLLLFANAPNVPFTATSTASSNGTAAFTVQPSYALRVYTNGVWKQYHIKRWNGTQWVQAANIKAYNPSTSQWITIN